MENISPQTSMDTIASDISSNVRLEQESQLLQQEQTTLELQEKDSSIEDKTNILATKEVLVIRLEEIRLRISEIEKEKKKKQTILTSFLKRFMSIKNLIENPVEQMKILKSEKLLQTLPEETLSVIKANYEKFNFIDYKLVEEALDFDEFAEELQLLNTELEQDQNQMAMFDSQDAVTQKEHDSAMKESQQVIESSALDQLEDITNLKEASNTFDLPFGGNPFEVIKSSTSNSMLEDFDGPLESNAEINGADTSSSPISKAA